MKNLEQCTDEELVKNIKNNDTDSLDFLLNKYKTLASRIARSYFLVGAEPEDLTQEAMIGLYKACHSYNESSGARFSTFAHTCINSEVQDAVRAANAKKNKVLSESLSLNQLSTNDQSDDILNEPIFYIPSTSQDPEDIFIENEKIAQIYAAIDNELSKKERFALKTYLQGFSYSEISDKLGISQKAVDNAISRAKAKLTKVLS